MVHFNAAADIKDAKLLNLHLVANPPLGGIKSTETVNKSTQK